MVAFEEKNYLIKEKLPEWWKNDLLLEPINQYTQELIVEMLSSLLNNLGVVQPIHVWKELPEEYNWTHQYYSGDDYLDNKINVFIKDTPLKAFLPNTKRNCHAIIKLSLQGDQQGKKNFIDLKIKNNHQEINFQHISNMCTIEINTQTHDILIDGLPNTNLVNGFLDKIQPTAKNTNFSEVSIEDENKITQLEFISSDNVVFDLNIELIKPVYTTEQHIRISTVSAFPLEWIKLYGFYCHEFNDKEGYRFVWEKHYEESSRVVYDKIATQFDFERFYIEVKFKNIDAALYFGFPQEILPSNGAFAINENLDKWGKIYGLPRRIYRDDISDDEEPFTFPKYYKYPIEQDYWYEERLVNEYRFNEDAINNAFIKDTDMNNVAILSSIDPFINDVWVYTETIIPEGNLNRETNELYIDCIREKQSNGVSWEYPQAIKQKNMISKEIVLSPLDSSSINNHSYQTKELEFKFNMEELPDNIEITGIELRIHAETNIHSEALKLDDRSKMLLPFYYTKENGEQYSVIEEIPINTEDKPWKKGQGTYIIGGKNYLFNLESVSKKQIEDYLHFKIGFTNESDFLETVLLIHNITAKLYYKIIKDKFDISVKFNTKEIILSQNQTQVKMQIHLKNTGKTKIKDKNVSIIVPPELELIDNRPSEDFSLDINESFTMGTEENNDEIIIRTRDNTTGRYDILVLCDDKIIQNEILVRRGFE